MSGKDVAQETVSNFEIMFDLSLTKDKMMDMMPGLLLFLARRPEMVESALNTMMPMMGQEFCSANAYNRTKMVLGSLVGHLVYGAILGAVAGPQAERLLQPRRVTIGWLQRTIRLIRRLEDRRLNLPRK